jgi:hypothetical protein
MTSTPIHPNVHPSPGHGLPLWRADRTEPERESGQVGGDNQVSDAWMVRLSNDKNHSLVDVYVYVVGYPDFPEDGVFDETGIEVFIAWSEFFDAEHEHEGFADITYEPGSALAYPTDDESVIDLFEHECKRIANDYIKNAGRDIWWDGHHAITH